MPVPIGRRRSTRCLQRAASNTALLLWLASMAFGAGTAAAEREGSELPACDESKPREPCRIILEPSTFVNGRTFRVRNGTMVTIKIEPVSPFERCSLSTKDRDAIAEGNAFQAFLAAVTRAGVPLALISRTASALPPGKAKPEVRGPNYLREIAGRFAVIAERESDIGAELESQYARVRELGEAVAALRLDPFRGQAEIRDMQISFEKDRAELVERIDAFKNQSAIPNAADIADEIKQIQKLIDQNSAEIVVEDPGALARLNRELSTARSKLGVLNEAISALGDAIAKLFAQRDFLETLPAAFSAEFKYSDINAVVKQEIACRDRQGSDGAAERKVLYAIEFRDPPRATLSAGALFSLLDAREIGSEDVSNPGSEDGFKTVFAETERAGLQIVPFTFLNFRAFSRRWLRREFVIGLSGGFGINPNNGGTDPEFFSGISFGFDSLSLQVGAHYGRWQELGGGFRLGETVPGDLRDIPVSRRYTAHWGFGVSYPLPLK